MRRGIQQNNKQNAQPMKKLQLYATLLPQQWEGGQETDGGGIVALLRSCLCA